VERTLEFPRLEHLVLKTGNHDFPNWDGKKYVLKLGTHRIHTVDGKNPAPVDRVNIPLFTMFYTSQVVQDFFHQQ